MKKFSGLKLKELVWKAATSSHVNVWNKIMLEIKGFNEEAFKYLIKTLPRF